MADTITRTSTVQIILSDSAGGRTTFNLDNPKQNLTMQQIRAALSEAILSGCWYSAAGALFTGVLKATMTESKKIELDNSEAEIYITPAEINLPNTTNPSGSVVVEGATVIGAYITQIATESINAKMYADCDGQRVTVTANFPGSDGAGTTALLNIVTDLRTVSIDIITAS